MNKLEQKIIDKTSKNEYAKKIVGLRKIPKNATILDQPFELDYHCPVCKYENVVNGDYDQRLEWSEYNEFIWCSVCNKDYPSCFCMPDINKATNIFLTSLQQVREETIKEILDLIDTELEIDLKPNGENDYNDGFNDACLEWDLLINTTIDRIKRGVFNKELQSLTKQSKEDKTND